MRVTAESLTRLMGLAGEALVQTHRLPPLVDVTLAAQREADGPSGIVAASSKTDYQARAFTLPAGERELLARSKAQAVSGFTASG